MRDELLKLAEECEKAEGVNFDLECRIGKAIGRGERQLSPPYTCSLDAALTLLPGPYAWSVERRVTFDCEAIVYGHEMHKSADAATPALAMCAAALRARAATPPQGDGT